MEEGQNYDHSVDMFSLGVIVYVLLSGSFPWPSRQSDRILDDIANCKYSFDNDVWKNVSSTAKDFIAKLILPKPGDRYNSKYCNKI